MNLTIIDAVNLIGSLASLILSVIAIWLALYFYNSSKNTEKEVNSTLTEIKTHTGALERLTGKWMDRFIRNATTPQPVDELQRMLLEIITVRVNSSVSELPNPQGETKTQLTEWLIASYLALYYYSGLTNLAVQSLLPIVEEADSPNSLKSIVDKSYADFMSMDTVIASSNQDLVRSSQLFNYYEEGLRMRAAVKTSVVVYSERAIANAAS